VNKESMYNRIQLLAQVLGFNPSSKIDVINIDLKDGHGKRWVLCTPEGDQPLPRTKGCYTLEKALSAAEDWLAPELQKFYEEKK